MKNKGFTLIELLAVIVILGIILVVAIPNVVSVLNDARNNVYTKYEEILVDVTKRYVVNNIKILPSTIGSTTKVTLSKLQLKGYIEEVRNPKKQDEACSGYTEIERTSATKYTYKGYIACGSDYATEGYSATNIVTYGGSDFDSFEDVVATSDSGYISVGLSSSDDGDLAGLDNGNEDAIIVKYNNSGNVVWKKNFGGNSPDWFCNVVVTVDGYIVVGGSYSTDGDLTGLNKGISDAIIVKYDFNGNVMWKKTFGGSSTESFVKVALTADGYVAVGYSSSTDIDLTGLDNGYEDAIIVKYDFNGNVVWKKAFGGSDYDDFDSVTVASDGYVAVGYSGSTDNDLTGLNKGYEDAIIVKYDLNGNVVWKKAFGGSDDDEFDSVVAVVDGYIAVGSSYSYDGDLVDLDREYGSAIIVKYDLNGNVVWKKAFGGDDDDYFEDLVAVSDGYIVTGFTYSDEGDLDGLKEDCEYSDALIVKYDLNGNVIWKKIFGGSGDEEIYGIATTGTNLYTIVGLSYSDDGDLEGINQGYADAVIFTVNATYY